ncbi:MAG: putative pilus biosis operon protein [Myxococcales bacterium]|nr:putative pilus biosis operon protein [Myxococcales bacterium]
MNARLFRLALAATAVCGLVFGVRQLRVKAAIGGSGAACVGDINRLTNPSGFTSTDFSQSTAVQVSSTGAQPIALDTNLVPLDPQKIKLPFDQDVTVKYVYRNAGASHMLGWFYLDDLKSGSKPFVKTDTSGNDYLADNDGDGIADWFQTLKSPNRPVDGLFHITGSGTTPDVSNSGLNYQDGASYYHKHVPHILEVLSGVANSSAAVDHTDDFIFQNCDDDADLTTWNNYAPANDVSAVPDGIPDYDVNNDGTIGNEADRTVDLGIIKGNKEIVFFSVTFYSSDLPNAGVGIAGSGSTTVRSLPWFTKNILNPDRGQKGSNTVLRKQAIGCERDVATCYTPLGADLGWMDLATIARLNTPTYHNIVLDNTVNIIKTDAAGNVPHFVVNAPSSDPNRWIMALEDLPAASADLDYNDVVFLIERINGGEVVSNNQVKAGDIPAGLTATDVMVSKIRFRFTAQYPSPGCDTVPDADIQFSWSVDGGVSWNPMGLPVHGTSGDLAIDVLGKGIVGHQLQWKATFVSSSQLCQPKLTTANVGYEAIPHGEYKFAAPVPLANVVFNGTVETPSSAWTVTASDYSLRGHFYSTPLFDPTTLADINPPTPSWDAGAVLASQSPSTRLGLFTNNAGAYMALTSGNGLVTVGSTTLYKNLLSPADRALKIAGNYLFDFTGDGVVDDKDALYVLEWTRGWETATITGSPPTAAGTVQRAWKLGAVHNSSPAVVGPPGHPQWLDGTNTSLSVFKTAYTSSTWQGSTTSIMTRRTLSLFGAADGMLHAVDAGNFHNPTELACAASATRLVRGCFAPTGGGSTTPDYGTGKEVWAYVPPTLLNALKNNTPKIRSSSSQPSYPRADVDGSVAVEDLYYTPGNTITGRPANQFVTGAFANLGRQWSAITAVGWTAMQFSGTTPVGTLPFPLWSQDFTDPDFIGGPTSPAVGVAITPSGVDWVVVATSGLANPAIDGTQPEYVYVLDASTGWVLGATTAPNASPVPNKKPTTGAWGKVTLDATGTTAYGFAGFPNMVDSDQDGVYDRAYVVDTAGRVFRVDLKLLTACKIATLGEPVFAGMGTFVVGGSQVRLYVAGGSNPDGTTLPAASGSGYPPYHVYGLEDTDVAGTASCTTAKIVYKFNAPNNEKVWAAPYVSDTTVYVASSGSTEAGLCANANGSFFGLSVDGNGATTNPAPASVSSTITLNNAGISSIRIYDGHAFINGISQQTAVVGKPGWNNKSTGGSGPNGPTMSTIKWSEQ